MNMKSYAVAFGLAALSSVTPASAMTKEGFQDLAERLLAPVISEYDVPGMAVGIVWRGQTFSYTTGSLGPDSDRPVTAGTLFELGSLSKTLNVTLAALAEVRGELSLGDSVAAHQADLQGTAFGDLTLMDLATSQTAGLPLQVPDGVDDMADLTRWIQAWKPRPDHGERTYSNISIGMLGHFVAETAEVPYASALSAQVLEPLGLTSTFVTVPDEQMVRYAWGSRDGQSVRVNPGLLDAEAYGLKSDLNDMLQFLRVNLGDVDVPDDLGQAIARTHQGQTQTAHFVQAMIWERYSWPVQRKQFLAGNSSDMALHAQPARKLPQPVTSDTGVLFSKTGSTNGFGGYLVLIPDEDFGLVLLANRNIPNVSRVDAALSLIKAVLRDQD